MPELTLKQDEIDHLMESIQGSADIGSTDNTYDDLEWGKAIVRKSKTIRALSNRLYFAMATHADPWIIKEAKNDLHNEAFGLWCLKRKIDKSDYYAIIKRELKKRNLRFIRNNPPGFKLVYKK